MNNSAKTNKSMWRKLGVTLVLTASLLLSSVAFGAAPEPQAHVKEIVEQILTLADKKVEGEAEKARDEALRQVIAGFVDYDDLAKRSLGEHWEPLTEEQRTEYKGLFRKLVELTYVDKLGNYDSEANYKLDWDEVQKEGENAHVIIFLIHEDTETEIDVYLKPDATKEWAVHDVLLDGASLEATYRKNYSKDIEEVGFDGLLKKMRDRIAELESK